MADKNSLGVVGLIFAGITAGVIFVAGMVVHEHVTGRLVLDSGHSVTEVSANRIR